MLQAQNTGNTEKYDGTEHTKKKQQSQQNNDVNNNKKCHCLVNKIQFPLSLIYLITNF